MYDQEGGLQGGLLDERPAVLGGTPQAAAPRCRRLRAKPVVAAASAAAAGLVLFIAVVHLRIGGSAPAPLGPAPARGRLDSGFFECTDPPLEVRFGEPLGAWTRTVSWSLCSRALPLKMFRICVLDRTGVLRCGTPRLFITNASLATAPHITFAGADAGKGTWS